MVLTKEERKERKRIANKKYNQSEKGKETVKKYLESEKGKETRKKITKSEKQKEYQKNYRKSEIGKINDKKKSWKSQGLKMDNFEEIYKRYLDTTHCDNCDCILTDGKPKTKPNTKCMDHHHETGEFRNILCWKCNIPAGVWV